MNYRKIIILPLFFFLSHLLYIGCCKCVDSMDHHYDFNNISVGVMGSGKTIIDTGVVTRVDTVYLRYSFDSRCVAEHTNPFSFMVNETMACKCVECGRDGIKTKISSITITSDSVYNGIPANNSLNNFFKENTGNGYITIDSLKNEINIGTYYYLQSLILVTTTKPSNNKGHAFKLRIVFVDGREVSATTKRIYWQ